MTVTVPDLNTHIRDNELLLKTSMNDEGHIIESSIASKTSNYTVVSTDDVILCTSGTFTVTLLTAVGRSGKKFIIKNLGTGVVTVGTTSSQTIDGSTTFLLNMQYFSLTVLSDGANWHVV